MFPIEVPKKAIIQNETAGNPGPLFWSITLPVDEVLEPSSPRSNIQDPGNREGWMVVDEPGGRRGLGRRAEHAGRHRLEQGNVERGMDLE